jgi:hypothetical protein
VSKLEVCVSTVALPVAGATQRYQIEAPPLFPAWFGSPASLVAPAFDPVAVPLDPEIDWALANMSFAGAAPVRAWTVPAHASAAATTTTTVPHRSLTH